jgi:hypothetical protein
LEVLEFAWSQNFLPFFRVKGFGPDFKIEIQQENFSSHKKKTRKLFYHLRQRYIKTKGMSNLFDSHTFTTPDITQSVAGAKNKFREEFYGVFDSRRPHDATRRKFATLQNNQTSVPQLAKV